jgi:hypothetical protein
MTSAINPNLIDGAYPVAGQDNNSQGFRDNFTNIKTNFQYTEDEINDLQTNVILKAALSGSTLDNNMGNALIYAAKVQAFSATKATISSTSGSITVNYQSGHYQSITTSGSISLAFTGFVAQPAYNYLKLQINITNVAHTVTLPGAVTLGTSGLQGYSGGVITFASTGTYEFGFGTYDGGTTITIFDLNRGYTNFSSSTFSGNVTAGNLLTGGVVSSTGNITGGNITSGGLVSITGNITGGNLLTGGIVSSTGNITGGNITALIRPPAGSASQAPIQLTSGTNLTTAAAGAIEFDGTVFYGSPVANERGVLSTEFVRVQVSNNTLSDVNTAQAVFSSPSAVALAASTTYEFEAVYYITRAAGTTSHTTSTLFNVSSALGSIAYTADVTTSTGVALTAVSRIYGTAPTALTVTGASTSATENLVITLKGVMRTSSATTVTPQFQYSAAPGGAPTVLPNSFIKFKPLGSSTVASVGAWS